MEQGGFVRSNTASEALRLLVTRDVALDSNSHNQQQKKLLGADIKRASFNASGRKKVCIELSSEDHIEGEDIVGEGIRSLYFTRDAPVN